MSIIIGMARLFKNSVKARNVFRSVFGFRAVTLL